MKSKAINKLLNGILISLIIVVIVTIFAVGNHHDDKHVSAAGSNLLIANDGNVSVYISGTNIDNLHSSELYTFNDVSHFYSEYYTTTGNSVTLSAISEYKVFTNWSIFYTNAPGTDLCTTLGVNPTHERITFNFPNTGENKLVVIAEYKTTISDSDYGKYFFNPFFIDDADDFNALSNIINNNFTNDDLEQFKKDEDDVITRELLLYGYFKITKSLTLNEDFKSIGTLENPFYGKIDGSNSGENAIVSINQIVEVNTSGHSGSYYGGIFGAVTSKNNYATLIRNIRTQGIVSVIEETITGYDNLYIGGVAGISGSEVLVVNCESKVDISAQTFNTNVYAGGFFGYSYTSIDVDRNLSINAEYKNWNISTTSNISGKGNVYVGGYAGYLANAYIYNYTVNTDVYTSSVSALGYGNVYHGGVVGYYGYESDSLDANISLSNDTSLYFLDTHLLSSDYFSISGLTNNGSSYVGGLIGYLDSSSINLDIANISVETGNTNESIIESSTKDENSSGDVYVGGAIAYINNYHATYNEDLIENNQPIFSGKINLEASQNGKSNSTIGRSVGGCIVGRGYLDVNSSEIFLNSEDSVIELNISQDKFAENTDYTAISGTNKGANSICIYEHISGGIFTGSVGTDSMNAYPLKDFVLVANNTTVRGTREEGSLSVGQITVGGLYGFTNRMDISNTKLLLNNSNLYIDSLSYECKIVVDYSNNAYLGGVVGHFTGNNSGNASMTNTIVAGYDFPNENKYIYDEANLSTAISRIDGIQNTQAGDKDYRGEIYVGGLIGSAEYAYINQCEYIGTSTEKNFVILRGNNNVDSAMVGGLIGLVRSQNVSSTFRILNCNVSNLYVQAEALSEVSNPDIYVGGMIGAVFTDGRTDSKTATINNCKVNNSTIHGIGHYDMKTYVGGILGGSCWNNEVTISNSVSYNNRIISSVDDGLNKKAYAYSGGICGFGENGADIVITGCGSVNNIIQSIISSNDSEPNSEVYAGGIFGRLNQNQVASVNNCYINSSISAVKGETNNAYVVGNRVNPSNNYYNSTTMNFDTTHQNSAIGVTFEDITGVSNGESGNLHGDQKLDVDSTLPYTQVVMTNPYTFTASQVDGIWSYKANAAGSTYADLWVKIIDNDTTIPSYENGWVLLGSTRILTTDVSGYAIETEYQNHSDDYVITEGTNDLVTINLNSQMSNLIIDLECYNTTTNTIATNLNISYTIQDKVIINKYGTFEFISNAEGTLTVKYSPNVDYLETLQEKFTITFNAGDASKVIEFTVNANAIDKMQGMYSDTTLPLNDFLKDTSNDVGSITYGSASDPYIYQNNTTIKIIPAFHRLYEGDIILDTNCQYVSYAAYTVTYNNGTEELTPVTIKSSGELVIGDDDPGTKYKVDITLLSNYNLLSVSTASIYITILSGGNITTNLKGAIYEGPFEYGRYDSNNPYYYTFAILPKSGFSGVPKVLTIEIGSNTYNLVDGYDVLKGNVEIETSLENMDIINISERDYIKTKGNDTIRWTPSDSGYIISISSEYLTSNIEEINITAEFNPVYSLLFDVNLDFDSIPEEDRYLSISATSEYTISSLIGAILETEKNEDNNEKLDENGDPIYRYNFTNSILKDKENLGPFGYTCHGWYLIEDASYVASYGNSIEELLLNYYNNHGEELKLNGNYTFYARWSFSIFLNEAPGTNIECSFPDTFLFKDKYNVNVPINNKKGFSFTIDKSVTFSGEADVNAHVLIRDPNKPEEDDEYILRPVTVQKYHDDMYVYTVAPEDINGVLVITTFSCDSEFIVGENTESVDESIVPEDGVFTIKYVVNHLEDSITKRQSFAYSSENIGLEKILQLSFVNVTNGSDYMLPAGTEIKLYYILNETETVVGYHKLASPTNKLFATDFVNINTNQKLFTTETFEEFFNGATSASEGYYFVVTPPNGYDSNTIGGSSYINCTAKIGYIKYDSNGNEVYLSAERYTFNEEDANKPPYYAEMKQAPSKLLLDESLHESNFIVYNSRITTIDKNSNLTFDVTDEYYSINVDGTQYNNPGDWRHNDKYFMLGVQVFLEDATKTPIDLSGLTINFHKDGTIYHSETVSYKLPKNAVYAQINGSGEYDISITIQDSNKASVISGFTNGCDYGLVVTLIESTSNYKPSMGVVRSDVVKTIKDFVAAKIWNGVAVSDVVVGKKISLPNQNLDNDDIVWTYVDNNGNTQTVTNLDTSTLGLKYYQSATIEFTGTIIKDGETYVKVFNVNVNPDMDALLSLLSFDMHIDTSDGNITDGVIQDNSKLIEKFEVSDLLPISYSLNRSININTNEYILYVMNYELLEVEEPEKVVIHNNRVYGWTEIEEVKFVVTYQLRDSLNNIIMDNIEKTYEVDNDTNNKPIKIGINEDIQSVINSMNDYIDEINIDTLKDKVIIFNDGEFKHEIPNVLWNGASSTYINNTNGVLSIINKPTVENGGTLTSSPYSLVYTTNDGTNRTHIIPVDVYVGPNTTIKHVFNSPTSVNNSSQKVTTSLKIGDTGYVMSNSITLNYAITAENWKYNNNRFTCSSRYNTISIGIEISMNSSITNVTCSPIIISDYQYIESDISDLEYNENDYKISGYINVTSNWYANRYNSTFSVSPITIDYTINWNRDMIS